MNEEKIPSVAHLTEEEIGVSYESVQSLHLHMIRSVPKETPIDIILPAISLLVESFVKTFTNTDHEYRSVISSFVDSLNKTSLPSEEKKMEAH